MWSNFEILKWIKIKTNKKLNLNARACSCPVKWLQNWTKELQTMTKMTKSFFHTFDIKVHLNKSFCLLSNREGQTFFTRATFIIICFCEHQLSKIDFFIFGLQTGPLLHNVWFKTKKNQFCHHIIRLIWIYKINIAMVIGK